MTKRTLKALNESIAHWRRLATGKPLPNETVGPAGCALCGLFLIGKVPSCNGCPVKARTGKSACVGTPYGKADEIYHRNAAGRRSKAFRQAAKAELKFLRSLLP